MNDKKWLNVAEYLLMAGSGVGSIAAIASQQLAFTAAPMSFLLLLNLVNRQRSAQDSVARSSVKVAHLDRKLSQRLDALDDHVKTLPTLIDFSSFTRSIAQRNEAAIAHLHTNIAQRLAPLEAYDHASMVQEMAQLQQKYTKLSESLNAVTANLNRLASASRVEGAERSIAQLRSELSTLHTKLNEVAIAQKPGIPKGLQDELNAIHRRLNTLPQPFDATAIRQDVDGLIRAIGDMVSRRELAKLMTEVEKIRQQNQQIEQTVAPMKAVNTIMRKQIDTLASKVHVKEGNSEPIAPLSLQNTVELEELKATIAILEQRLNTLPNGSDLAQLHSEMQTMVNGHLSKLQQQFSNVQEFTQNLERQQKDLTQWIEQLPEMLDSGALKRQMKHLAMRLDLTEEQLSSLQPGSIAAPSSEYELVFNLQSSTDSEQLSTSRALIEEAIKTAQSRLVLVFPYPDRTTIDSTLIQQFEGFLARGGMLDLGWGHLGEQDSSRQVRYIHDRDFQTAERKLLTTLLNQLNQLKRQYPDQFRFKVLGTDENFLVCDAAYAILGVHPMATTSAVFPEMAVGLRTINAPVIQGLVDRFNDPVLAADDEVGYFKRAVTRYELGDLPGAIADYSEVIRINPEHHIAYNNRALVRHEQGDLSGAMADLNRSILSHPHNYMAYCNRGVLKLRSQDDSGAIEDFSHALYVDSDCVPAFFQRGLVRLRLDQKSGAIEDFSHMIRINAQDPIGYFHRGVARSKTGDKTMAIRDFKEAAWLFSSQGDNSKYQHAIDAISKLRKRHSLEPAKVESMKIDAMRLGA